ncbi:MAG TPA: hypothetical protein ENJ19_08575 [Gammaproteobacteria bacterium]|nr:hypothetical protein [Gammaproteobacteria bacterium]
MQFNLETHPHEYTIRAYAAGQITVTLPWNAHDTAPEALDAIGPGPHGTRVKQEVITGSVIVTPTHLLRNWPPRSVPELEAGHMQALLELQPEVVLLGSGARLLWPAPDVLAPLLEAGIGYEVMDTAAACRTYNILMGDGRRVAAALCMI